MAMKKLNPDLLLGLVSTGILAVSSISHASDAAVTLGGIALPPVCGFKLLTSWDCPGCGLTRSLIFALHGHFQEAYYLHIWGIPLMIILAAQLPYRAIRLIRPNWNLRLPQSVKKWVSPAVFLSLMIPWAVRTIALLAIRYL